MNKKIELIGRLFEIVNNVPINYFIWNIGANMPEGYLPICRLSPTQLYPGGRSIDVDSLKVIETPAAQTILEAASYAGCTTTEMEDYIHRNKKATKGSWNYTKVEKAKAALPFMKKIKGL